ncbi:glycosyltransferase family 2 protein [bacterium]|nr:glycosyltransferase family 2 protein [bacterium]
MAEFQSENRSSLISCLVVTGNRPALLKRAILCYNNQTHKDKELVVVDDGETDLTEVLAAVPSSELKYLKLEPDPARTLGELRNVSLDFASGAYMAQWDDDDWYHPDRLRLQFEALQKGFDACCLAATLMHVDGPEMDDHPYVGELPDGVPGTIMHVANATHRYPKERKGEDSFYLKFWMEGSYTKLPLEYSHLFIRCFHGHNTWGENHFTRRIRNSPLSLLEYVWCKYVLRDVYRHSSFKLSSTSLEAMQQFKTDSNNVGLVLN